MPKLYPFVKFKRNAQQYVMNNMDIHHANYFSSLQKNTQSVDTERPRVNPHSFKVTQTLLAGMCGEWISGALAPLHMTEVMKIFILFCSDFALMFKDEILGFWNI